MRPVVSIVFVALASSLATAAARQLPRPTATGLIAGRVVDAYSGEPIGGVSVSLQGVASIEAVIDATGKVTVLPNTPIGTDSQGRFAIGSVRAGNYTVLAVGPAGFGSASAAVELAADQSITDVTVRVARLGSISGTVRDESGDPIVRMRVDVHLKRTAGFRPLLLPRGGTQTDDRGQFRIGNLPAGEYVVCACSREPLAIDKSLLPLMGPVPPSADAVAQRLGDSVPTFPPTFPPGTTQASEAAAVVIAAPDEHVRVDIAIRSVTPRSVSGQLIGIGRTDLTKWTLILLPENDQPEVHAITAIASVRLAPTGAFEFVAVPPGRYSLEGFQATQGQDRWASMSITVGAEDITGLVVPVTEGATISGHLEFSGSAIRPDAAALEKARVTLAPADFTSRTFIATGASGTAGHDGWVRANGTFEITGVAPGRYLIMANRLGPEWQLTESVRSGSTGVVDPILTVGVQGVSDVVITMSDAVSAMVLGTVALDKYESPQTVRVLLFPAAPSTWSEPMRFPGRFVNTPLADRNSIQTTTAPPGHVFVERNTFRITTVPPGEYFVTTVAADAYIGPEQFAQLSRNATHLSLREGQSVTVELSSAKRQ